jgi:flavodoxin
MKTVIVYHSKFGNTEQIARAIAQELESVGPVQLVAEGPLDLEGVDLFLAGGPTHAHGMSAELRERLDLPHGSLDGVAAAAFDTRYHRARWLTGSAAGRIARHLRRAGANLVVPPESFFVVGGEGPLEDGEIERARSWAGALRDVVAARVPATSVTSAR